MRWPVMKPAPSEARKLTAWAIDGYIAGQLGQAAATLARQASTRARLEEVLRAASAPATGPGLRWLDRAACQMVSSAGHGFPRVGVS
jgi:hypothetical protein